MHHPHKPLLLDFIHDIEHGSYRALHALGIFQLAVIALPVAADQAVLQLIPGVLVVHSVSTQST